MGAAPAAGRAGICSVGQGIRSDPVKEICGPGDIGLEAREGHHDHPGAPEGSPSKPHLQNSSGLPLGG